MKLVRGIAPLAVLGTMLLFGAAPATAQCWTIICVGGSGGTEPSPSPTPAPSPSPQRTPPPIALGFNDTAGHHREFPEPVFQDLLVDTGAKLHRWPASWGNYEPVENEYHPGYLDHLHETYANSLARGIRPVIQLFGAPRWTVDSLARTPGGGQPCVDSGLSCNAPPNVRSRAIRADWKRWVQTIARRFPKAAAIEIWNEPNLQWAWVIKQDPQLYAQLLATANTALWEIGSKIPLLTGGLGTVSTSDDRNSSLELMLKTIYDFNRHSFDAISFHSYPCAHDADVTSQLQKALERVRRIKASRNDVYRPLWITETGAASASSDEEYRCGLGFTDETQGPALRAITTWARQTQAKAGDLPALFVNTLVNPEPRSSMSEPNPDAPDEYGVVAWTLDPETQATTIWKKPGYYDVRCAFRQLC